MAAFNASQDIVAAAQTHLEVLAEFAAVVGAKLATTANPFAQESLADLMNSLVEQRLPYEALVAAANPAPMAA